LVIGIREGVEAIAEYPQRAASLQFTFGLVEAQAFELAPKGWIIQSCVLAGTAIISRTVVEVAAPGMDATVIEDTPNSVSAVQLDEPQKWMLEFWTELIASLRLDDREQPIAKPPAGSNIFFPLPAARLRLRNPAASSLSPGNRITH
jgi:hypothetical protein